MNRVLFALLQSYSTPLQTAIEVVDLDSLQLIRSSLFSDWWAWNLAVSPDLRRVYVTDFNHGVHVVDPWKGTLIATIDLSCAVDCALSGDGRWLYVTTSGFTAAGPQLSVVSIDTHTNTIVQTLSTGADYVDGITLSPDGSQLAVAVKFPPQGQLGAIRLIDAATLTDITRLALTPPAGTQLQATPSESVFVDDQRLLVTDPGADALYQVDLVSQSQLVPQTVALGDDYSWPVYYNKLRYSALFGRAYVIKDSTRIGVTPGPLPPGALAVIDPASPQFTLYGGFNGNPWCTALTPTQDTLLVSVMHDPPGTVADSLDLFDLASETFTRTAYTFSRPTLAVLDMHVCWVPRTINPNRYLLYTQILVGVINDAPGVVVPPGGHPEPVPPWGPMAAALTPWSRDVLTGLAIDELARTIADSATRNGLRRTALGFVQDRIRSALDSIG